MLGSPRTLYSGYLKERAISHYYIRLIELIDSGRTLDFTQIAVRGCYFTGTKIQVNIVCCVPKYYYKSTVNEPLLFQNFEVNK